MNIRKIFNKQTNYNKTQVDMADCHDNNCQNCNSKRVVSKIVGYIQPYQFSSQTEIKHCRHCSDCGSDWERATINKRWAQSYFKIWISDLQSKIKIFDSKLELDKIDKPINFTNIQMLEGVYAETIHEFQKLLNDKISLRILRKHFKSIFDN